HPVGRLHHVQIGELANDFGEMALGARFQMEDEKNGKLWIVGEPADKLFKRFEPTRRGAHADEGKLEGVLRLFPVRSGCGRFEIFRFSHESLLRLARSIERCGYFTESGVG